MPNQHLLIASTSTVYGSDYLEYLKPEIQEFFLGIPAITFIPFARPGGITHEEYTASVRKFFESIGIQIIGIHEVPDLAQGVKEARGLFIGGGNTFALLNALYENNLLEVIKEQLKAGVCYMGTSAGSNILGPTVQTTNDMPIVYPPSFRALGAVPFNINPHYLDPQSGSKHMGETRETRILEFLAVNPNATVVGLREGSYLVVKNDGLELKGDHSLRLFVHGKEPREIDPGSNLSFLLKN